MGFMSLKMVQFGGNLLGNSRFTLNRLLKLFWNLSLIMGISGGRYDFQANNGDPNGVGSCPIYRKSFSVCL